jgi:hypothetical protein
MKLAKYFYQKSSQQHDMAQCIELPDIVRHACCYRVAAVTSCPAGLIEKIALDD